MTDTATNTFTGGIVGERRVRKEDPALLTGEAKFIDDLHLPGALWVACVRSPHAHARIKSIDVSRALALPGVHAVVTGDELAKPSGVVADLAEGTPINARFMSNNILAEDKVLYKGHAVAAVAADNPHVAEQALSFIDVEYEVLPFVLEAKEAMKEGAPLVHERLANTQNRRGPGGLRSEDDTEKSTNVANRFEFILGEPESGFESADVIVEKEISSSSTKTRSIAVTAAPL